MRRLSSIGLALAVGAAGGITAATPGSATAATCTTTVSAGSSVQNKVDSAGAGSVICLRGGTHGRFTVTRSGLTIQAYPGETATIRGQTLVKGVSSATLRNLRFTGATSTFQAGLRVESSSGVKVLGSRTSGNSLGIYLKGVRNSLVENNTVTDNAFGIEVHGTTTGTIIRGNRINHNNRYLDPSRSAGGMNLYKTSGGITVANNEFIGNREVAIEIYAASDILISGNRMTGSNDLIETGTSSGAPCNNLRIVRNIGWNSSIGTGGEERGFYLRCASNSLVAHNVFDGLDKFAVGIFRGSGGFNGPIDNLRILNNISVNGRAYSIDSSMPSSVKIDNNLITRCTSGTCPVHGSKLAYVAGKGNTTSISTLRSWGYEARGISADPLFVGRSARDYRVRDGSPAINRGVRISGINDSFLGSAPDIGRFER
jgi:parallel beta-helix repeat protein